MPVSLDSQFSVYDLVQRVHQRQSAILNHRRTMNLISYEIENATLVDHARARIFAGFQHMSKFLPQIARYRQLAKRAEQVYVFGVPDITPPPIDGITYICLKPTDQLAKEWFLVSYGQGYASVLATEELTAIDDPDESRMFRGVWSLDLNMAALMEEWLSSTVDAPRLLISEDDHDYHQQAHLVENITNRLMRRVMVEMKPENAAIIQGEVRTILKDTLYPVIQSSKAQAGQQMAHKEHEAVILFADMRNFSSLAERMSPTELVTRIINPYLTKVTKAVYDNGGVVDKFLGDGVLAVFGHETPGPYDAESALNAARQALVDLRQEIALSGLGVGIGLAMGPVRIGAIGSELVSERTIIGDAVNAAQRLSDFGDNDIYLSHRVYESLHNHSGIEDQGPKFLKGKSVVQRVYRAYGTVRATDPVAEAAAI